jgi:hypothetical protein
MQSQTPPTLTDAETATLRSLVAAMLPASAEHGVPGADDPTIFADLLASLGRDTADVQQALVTLARFSPAPFAELAEPRRAERAAAFNAAPDAATLTLQRLLLLCYYRDDRVMRALGQEPRPPFPKGFTVEQGDWALLDSVRRRAKLWRDAP